MGMAATARVRHHRSSRTVRWIAGALALLLTATDSFGQAARVEFSIPAQPLASGLLQLGHQANISIAFDHALVADKNGTALQGEMDVDSALARILNTSGLTFEFVRPTLVRIIAAPASRVVRKADAVPPAQTGMEEVSVTARRRPESSGRVPIFMSVMQGDELAAANLNDVADISSRVPSLQFRTNPTQKDRSIFIRGIGTVSTSQSTDPSVSTVIDGVVMARAGQAMADLLDLNQIEVLNGPQGTLFGKNASAGVLNITTLDPTPYLSGYARLGYYEGDEYRVSAGISGPLSQNVTARIAAFDSGYPGNMKNVYSGRELNGYRHNGARAKLVATPSDDLKLTFSADLIRAWEDVPGGAFTSGDQYQYCPRYLINPPAPNPCTRGRLNMNPFLTQQIIAGGVSLSPDNSEVSHDSANKTFDSNGGTSLQVDWRPGADYLLTSISAWREWRNTLSDYDYDQLSAVSPYNFPKIVDDGHVRSTQTSQELRLTSPKEGYVDFVAGLYFLRTESRERYMRTNTLFLGSPDPVPWGNGINHFGSTGTNYAAYGEMNFNIAPRLHAFLGYREIWDRLGYFTNRVGFAARPGLVFAVAPDFASSGSNSTQGWAGRTGVQWDVTPDVMTYATVSRGYKGPAYNVFFNMQAFNTKPVDPERSDAYEIGVKSTFWGRRIRLDAAVFDTELANYQANITQQILGSLVTNLVNAGSAVTRGVEVSLRGSATSRLTYNLDAQYDDAYIRSVPCQPNVLECALRGNTLPFAPKWKLNVGQDYRQPLSSTLELHANVAYRWQSLMQFQLVDTPDSAQPSYGIWDLSLGLRDPADRWSGWLVVKNVLDKDYSSYRSRGDLGGIVRWVPRDANRYVGINAQFNF